ncbi:cytochrome c-type biogenesis protein CcmE [Arboricoccus pini]|uniref:Cytochrome c-type biogenesis protein CcmE n=1 Tax=Arboricoccus pini TaxID=1963835 RepID=A0A212PYE3_9PROT|nr:cytochrome c maturation protein CcmE [Arboricoccus pini]SNB52009.1 cytochrome c-type biogenesis protein CcmE [Arboricoccus pini]
MRLKKQHRLVLILLVLILTAGSTTLVLTALGSSVAFFVSPADIASGKVGAGKRFRLGGLVADGSVRHEAGGEVRFAVTDGKGTVNVDFTGLLPDLFREGQGIVAQGTLGPDGTFQASEVLAKHDERYMPPEVAEALKRSGHWQEGSAASAGPAPGTASADASKDARPGQGTLQ